MPRFYNTGKDKEGNPLKPPLFNQGGKTFVKVPPMFQAQYGLAVPAQPGAAILAMQGLGFWVIGPEETIHLPDNVPVEDYLAHAPSLEVIEESPMGTTPEAPTPTPVKAVVVDELEPKRKKKQATA